MLIINSVKAARDLMEKKGAIYSDRPRLVFGGELVGWDRSLALTPYGERFRAFRRLSHRLFGSRAQTEKYHSLEERETKLFLRRVVKDPNGLVKHIRKSVFYVLALARHADSCCIRWQTGGSHHSHAYTWLRGGRRRRPYR